MKYFVLLSLFVVLFMTACNGRKGQRPNNIPQQQQEQPGVMAQNRPEPGNFDPKKMAERQVKMLTEKLGLTKQQQKQVKKLNIKMAEKMQAMHENKKEGNPEEMHKKMQEERNAMMEEMKSILTEEQYTKYQELQKEMEKRRPGHGGPKPE